MKRKLVYVIGGVLALFMVVTNFTFLGHQLPQTYPRTYCSDKCKFWTLEKAKGHNTLWSVENSFNMYKVATNQPNLVLYRRFERKWWQLWNWYNFLTSPCWDYPYAKKDEDT